MSLSPDDIIKLTHEMLQKRDMGGLNTEQNQQEEVAFDCLVPDDIELKDGEFLIKIYTSNTWVLFCAEELSWYDALNIEVQSFRNNASGNNLAFSGEHERRETLKKAIKWVYVLGDKPIKKYNDHKGSILKELSQNVIDLLWEKYKPLTVLSAAEAAALYKSSKLYFRGEAQSGVPISPLIIEVDFWLKGVQWSNDDFKKRSASDLERIQLILAARSDALGISSGEPKSTQQHGIFKKQ